MTEQQRPEAHEVRPTDDPLQIPDEQTARDQRDQRVGAGGDDRPRIVDPQRGPQEAAEERTQRPPG